MPSKKVKQVIFGAILIICVTLLARYTDTGKQTGIVLEKSGMLSNNAGYLTLNLEPASGKIFSITGWKLAGGLGEVTINSASPLPLQGKINEEVPVVITRASTLVILPGESPIGVSFRENKCTWLLGNFQEFIPPLEPTCFDCVPKSDKAYPEYNLCVEAHKNDPDFFRNSWRIYLNSDALIWREKHEVIRLYDQQNKLLDILSY